jgi:hypothetical protein
MSLWFLPWALDPQTKTTSPQSKRFESYFLKAVGEDMAHYKPQLIFLEKTQKNQDILLWLKQNPWFKKEWAAFIPLQGDFGEFDNFFLVYMRRDLPDHEQVARVLEKTIKDFSE